jgi:hypothetical protein
MIHARVTGGAGDYTLLLLRNAVFDTEPNDDLSGGQKLASPGTALGAVGARGAAPITAESEPNDDGVPGGSVGDLPYADDWSGSFRPAGGNRYTATVTGEIDEGSDRDWDFFRIMAMPGDTLEVELRGRPSGQGTLGDPYLRFYDREGVQIAANDDTYGLESFIRYDSLAYTGAYYVVADSFGSGTGTYTLAGSLVADHPYALQQGGDDFYRLDVRQGDRLTIETRTPGGGGREFVNDLDPAVALIDPQGIQAAADDNSAGDARNVWLEHTAATTGVYGVRVSSTNGTSGEYILRVAGHTGGTAPLGTPVWWLFRHGLTNAAWYVEELSDGDADGMAAWEENIADTDPTRPESVLRIVDIAVSEGGAAVGWTGGESAWQYLDVKHNVTSAVEAWQTIFTNPPPTPAATNVFHPSATDSVLFYRIRAVP